MNSYISSKQRQTSLLFAKLVKHMHTGALKSHVYYTLAM